MKAACLTSDKATLQSDTAKHHVPSAETGRLQHADKFVSSIGIQDSLHQPLTGEILLFQLKLYIASCGH